MSLSDTITKAFNSAKNFASDHSPQIFMGIGVASIVGGVVFAIKDSRKLDDILEEHKVLKEHFNEIREDTDEDIYTPATYKRDLAKVHARTALKCVKTYAPTVLLTGAGIASMIFANHITTKRYKGAVLALNGVTAAFAGYRQRVKDELGEEMDNHLYYGTDLIKKKVDVVETDDDGNTKVVKEEGGVIFSDNSLGVSEYARFFDEFTTEQYTGAYEYDKSYILNTMNYAKDRVLLNGRCTLNYVYESLGLPASKNGAVVGWKSGDIPEFKVIEGKRPILWDNDGNPTKYQRSFLIDFNAHYIWDDYKDQKFQEDDFVALPGE